MERITSTASIIIIGLLVLFFVYVLMIYPEDRQKLLDSNTTTHRGIISIECDSFNPAEITIQKGSSVTWVNNCISKQRINGADFTSPILLPHRSYTHTFEKNGVFVYSSEFNPELTGKVIVK